MSTCILRNAVTTTGRWFAGSVLALLLSSGPSVACDGTWDLGGLWTISQDNGFTLTLTLFQNGHDLNGSADFRNPDIHTHYFTHIDEGRFEGTSISFRIPWSQGLVGVYTGTIDSLGRIAGTTFQDGNRGSSAGWSGNRAANCIALAPPSTVPANPLPTRTLGKWKFFATAKDDVDIYAGPGGNFENTGVVMRKDERALSLRQHPDGWRMLQLTCGKPECWVAEDHLKIVGIPPLGAKCPAGTRKEADGCHF